jgi:hypothetical protein
MATDLSAIRKCLQQGDLKRLFIEELGWDHCDAHLTIPADGSECHLHAVAQKRGMVAYVCEAPSAEALPKHPDRSKIEKQVAKSAHEHIIVFTDSARTTQVWQWVRREAGKPRACREHRYHRLQPGEALAHKLQAILFTLEDEEELSLPDVTARARRGFDVERVTKKFYDRFKKEHGVFLAFVSGISDKADLEWYTSVMLNRLMFVYFVQKKGFLDGDPDYLRNRLFRCRRERGKDKFYSFYRLFLLRLFHEGLGGRARTRELDDLLGHIPYLNGGLFERHQIEKAYPDIEVPDEAFERVFNYFDEYQWYLDERPLRADNEINPDVLGYIFEKYINQKQMGAYYTKEDITEYISKNTVIPFLLGAARAQCKVAFENPSGPTVWDLLRGDPDRYVYPAVRHGLDRPLPADVSVGLNPPSLHQPVGEGPVQTLELRGGWNRLASPELGLPTETWREVVTRRARYQEVRDKLAGGRVRDISDLITLNLDVRQFIQDAIAECEAPEVLRAFWHSIEKMTILDPTCGSGAFLFAALNILEPLYEGCLDRMESFVEDVGVTTEGSQPADLSDFRQILAHVDEHPNRRYFVFKSIILNNLFGVDLMEEAVEICKLRLFLKLAAQVEPDPGRNNLGIEPLPDIDFNIKAGNTLVGFATYEGVKRAVTRNLAAGTAMEEIAVKAADLQQAFDAFRDRQVEGDGSVPAEQKLDLRNRLAGLQYELNRYLASEYGIYPSKYRNALDYEAALEQWLRSHAPFHWFIEFFGIMSAGGFDIIIGNPPYVELKALNSYRTVGYRCEPAGNLYALVMERSASICRTGGRQGFIVPVSSVSTDRYVSLQQLLLRREDHFSSYDDRPSRLFDGLEHIRLTIHILGPEGPGAPHHSTRYNKWNAEERSALFGKLVFAPSKPALVDGTLLKLTSALEQSVLRKLAAQRRRLGGFYSRATSHSVFYSRKVGYFLQVLDFEPRVLDGNGVRRPPSEFKALTFAEAGHARVALCCLNSSLFYWFITVFSDCRHINKRDVDAFPLDLESLARGRWKQELVDLGAALMLDMKRNALERVMTFKHDTLTIQCIYPKASKPIIDSIDLVLARHYGLTEEEVDFIMNYDIKYRMGGSSEDDGE